MRNVMLPFFALSLALLTACSDNPGTNNQPWQKLGYSQQGNGQNGYQGQQMQQPAASSNYAPGLQAQQGRYFRWSMPAGWRVSESNAGVTLLSPDGRYGASLAAIMRSRGNRTPKDFLHYVFTHVSDYKNASILSIMNLPSQRMGHQVWNYIEAEVSYIDRGLPVTGDFKVGVSNNYGQNDAVIVGFRATNQDYQQAKSFLPVIAKSIVLTNGNQAFGNNTIISPKNNPNTAHDSIIAAGQYKNKSQDRSNQNWSNSMRGSQPTYDPATGRTYTSQHSTWNAAKGGYVNPNRPTELLNCGTPANPQPCQ